MLEKQIQSIGMLTHQKIAAASEALRSEIESQGEHVEKQCSDILDLLEKEITSLDSSFDERLSVEVLKQEAVHLADIQSIRESLTEQKESLVADINGVIEQLQERKDLEQELTERIASIKDGEDGKDGENGQDGERGQDGENGEDGKDGEKGQDGENGEDGEKGEQGEQGEAGLDRPLIEPVQLIAEKDYPKNTHGLYNGGLWISTKDSRGCPQDDPHAWHCILDAVTDMSIDLQEDRTFKLSAKTSAGNLIEDNFTIPFPEHKGIWEEGDYFKGDIVTKGSSFWQALEDTSGQPPGNGWLKILSAPRGRDGKSIIGPQGKPGRNGLDAKIPDELIDELKELASKSKAFEDQRSGAYAVTSYRGYFLSGEAYSSGDVVNFNGSLFLCTSSGSFDNFAESNGSFELMLEVPKHINVPYMQWKGQWEQKAYSTGMTVSDVGWTMVALRDTADRAAPRPVGEVVYAYDGTMVPFENTAKTIIYGQRYTNSQSAIFIRGVKIEVITGNHYGVYVVSDSEQGKVYELVDSFTAETTGLLEINTTEYLFRVGQSVDLVVVLDEPDPTPTIWTANYDYDTPNNASIPLVGQISNANLRPESLRISTTDSDAGDRTAELAALAIGDRITVQQFTWTISAIVDNTTWFDFTVLPAQQYPADGVYEFSFNTVTPTPITIGRDVGYWSGNTEVSGLLAIDGGYADLVEGDDAYGIVDLKFQEAVISTDWGVVSHNQGGSGDAGALSTSETAWVKDSATESLVSKATTTTNGWVPIALWPIADGQGYDVEIKLKGKRTDDVGFSVGRYGCLAFRDGAVYSFCDPVYEHLFPGLTFRARAETNGVVFEVDGRNGQSWDWNITLFAKEIV